MSAVYWVRMKVLQNSFPPLRFFRQLVLPSKLTHAQTLPLAVWFVINYGTGIGPIRPSVFCPQPMKCKYWMFGPIKKKSLKLWWLILENIFKYHFISRFWSLLHQLQLFAYNCVVSIRDRLAFTNKQVSIYCRCITALCTQGTFSAHGCQIFCLRFQFLASDLTDHHETQHTYLLRRVFRF